MANKKITELQLVDAITDDLNLPVDDSLQTYRATIAQIKAYLAPIYVAPSIERFTATGAFTYNLHYTFIVSSASATVGATYTNNGVTYTVVNTVASGSKIVLSGNGDPTTSGTLTKASGTGDSSIIFSKSIKPIALEVILVGPGGGGASSGTGSRNAGSSGSADSTFGSSLLTAAKGIGGSPNAGNNGATGGAATVNTPAIAIIAQTGGTGGGGSDNTGGLIYAIGSIGGSNMMGGHGPTPAAAHAGENAVANSGGGGSGASSGSASGSTAGAGGSAGAFIKAIIPSPSTQYTGVIGAGGAGGSAGTSGSAGGAGAAGFCSVMAIFQ